MQFRSYIAAGAIALIPALVWAAQSNTQPAAKPVFINFDGHAVPVKSETHLVQTADGPMKVSTWSWHSPNGGASFVMQSSTGGAGSMAPAVAMQHLRAAQAQLQVAQAQMQAAQAQMIAMQARMQAQMEAIQQAAFGGTAAMPVPQLVGWGMPAWMPGPVIIEAPAPAQEAVPAVAPQAPARTPGIKA